MTKIPERQRLANALCKLKRAEVVAQEEAEAESAEVEASTARSTDGLKTPVVLLNALPMSGLVLTADGAASFVNESCPSLSASHAAQGPVLRQAAQLARLAHVAVAVPMVAKGVSAQAIDLDAFSRALVADVAVLLPWRWVDAEPPRGCHPLPTTDDLARDIEADERPTAQWRFSTRTPQAIWRGGRGVVAGWQAPSGRSCRPTLREQVVNHCDGRDGYDVAFRAAGTHMSLRQMRARRVLLLIDGPSWDPAWKWALASGCVLVHIGRCLPPVCGLRAHDHFVPVSSDLSDLDEKVEWALRSPDAAALAGRCAQLHHDLCSAAAAKRALVRLFADLVSQAPAAAEEQPDEQRRSGPCPARG